MPLLGVGLSEEVAKLIFPIAIYLQGRYRSESDGIVFGVASGMGFAALETMGYSFVSLIASKGDLGVVQETLLVRGLLSPAGHAAWTGSICAVLWRERERVGARHVLNAKILAAFVVAVVLHALWDTFQSVSSSTFVEFLAVELLSLIIALTSFGFLIRLISQANRRAESTTQP